MSRTRDHAVIAALLLSLAACGDDVAHPASFPEIIDHGGRHAGRLNIVTMTYRNDPLAQTATDFDAWVLGSQWLAAVGGDYGVHAGGDYGVFSVGHDAPATMTTADVVADLEATIPAPSDTGDQLTVAMIYLPRGITFTDPGGFGTLCRGAAAFHRSDGDRVYAIIPDCDGTARSRTALASHELIEAATDPFFDGFYADGDDHDGWHYIVDNEVADLCEYVDPYPVEGGFTLERSWSRWAALDANPVPCVPVPDGSIWYFVDVDPSYLEVAAGKQATVALRGWSSQPDAQWNIGLLLGGESMFTPAGTLDTKQFVAGGTATLTVTVPIGTPSGESAVIEVAAPRVLVPIELVVP